MYMHTSENFELFQQLSLTTCTSKSMRDVTYILKWSFFSYWDCNEQDVVDFLNVVRTWFMV